MSAEENKKWDAADWKDLELIGEHLPMTQACLLVAEAYANPLAVKRAVVELKKLIDLKLAVEKLKINFEPKNDG